MSKLSIVKAPTGFGKTFGYVNEALSNDNKSKLVVAPTNDLKDEIYSEMIMKCQEQTEERILQYLDIYRIAVAYTLRYVCGFGKKRLPEVMQRIWNNVDSFKTGHLSINDCIQELKENGIEFETIVKDQSKILGGKYHVDK